MSAFDPGLPALAFSRFLNGFIAKHPEWYGVYEAERARERFQEALARVPAAEPVKGDELAKMIVDAAVPVKGDEISDLDIMAAQIETVDLDVAEEVVDEEAEAEEATAVLSDGEF